MEVTCDPQVQSPAIVGFLEQDYRYKSVDIQIYHAAELVTILYTGRAFLPQQRSNQHRIP